MTILPYDVYKNGKYSIKFQLTKYNLLKYSIDFLFVGYNHRYVRQPNSQFMHARKVGPSTSF